MVLGMLLTLETLRYVVVGGGSWLVVCRSPFLYASIVPLPYNYCQWTVTFVYNYFTTTTVLSLWYIVFRDFTEMTVATTKKPRTIYLPEELADKAKRLADAEGRSVNNLIEQLLKSAVAKAEEDGRI